MILSPHRSIRWEFHSNSCLSNPRGYSKGLRNRVNVKSSFRRFYNKPTGKSQNQKTSMFSRDHLLPELSLSYVSRSWFFFPPGRAEFVPINPTPMWRIGGSYMGLAMGMGVPSSGLPIISNLWACGECTNNHVTFRVNLDRFLGESPFRKHWC